MPKRYRRTTVRVPGVRVADDVVDRNVGAVDRYSRRIVGWSMRPDLDAELVVDALEMAIARRRPAPRLVHHSDRGRRGSTTFEAFYNPARLHSSRDYRSPIEYEKIVKEQELPNQTGSTKPGAV